MEGTIVIVAIIAAAAVAITAIIVIGICIIHQGRLINQINMNAQLLVSEAIEKERVMMEEYQNALKEIDASQTPVHTMPSQRKDDDDEPSFNPHNYSPED